MMQEHQPEFVFLGIRFPKQNRIALGMMGYDYATGELTDTDKQIPLFLLLGASYEFYLNLKKRAPVFWQKIGMEWFYRFTQEPGRLFRRYFIDDIQFFPIVWKERKKVD
jgi:N-acetylglucosaminyldiphosphoundecaprenol N-acetyl-beta-D-mannosaminyltransferase